MICPKCRSEYREGFSRCADCDVALVSDLDQEPEESAESGEQESDLVAVLDTKDSSMLSDIVSHIEEKGIPYLLQSGTAIGLESLFPSNALEWRAVLYVPKNLEEKVDSLIADVKTQWMNRTGEPSPED
jgi:hypothetical protein